MFHHRALSGISSRLAVAGLLLAVLSSACGSCFAAVADQLPAPAQGSSGGCHPGDQPAQPDSHCGCPALLSATHFDLDVAVAPVRAGIDEATLPHAVAPILPRRAVLAGGISPGGLPAVPPLSPIRNFGVRLE